MWILIIFRVCFRNFLWHELPVFELKAFSKSIFKITFSVDWELCIKQRKTYEANSAPLLLPTPTCRFPYLAWRDSETWYPAHFADNRRKVLPTAIGRSPSSGFFSAIIFAPKKYDRSTKGSFPSTITFTSFVKALRKFNPVCPFDLAVKSFKIWGEMPSNPALEPLGEHMRALWTKIFRGLETIHICGVRNRASFPLRMFQLKGSVVVDREVCNLVVAYCHFDSGLNFTFV